MLPQNLKIKNKFTGRAIVRYIVYLPCKLQTCVQSLASPVIPWASSLNTAMLGLIPKQNKEFVKAHDGILIDHIGDKETMGISIVPKRGKRWLSHSQFVVSVDRKGDFRMRQLRRLTLLVQQDQKNYKFLNGCKWKVIETKPSKRKEATCCHDEEMILRESLESL